MVHIDVEISSLLLFTNDILYQGAVQRLISNVINGAVKEGVTSELTNYDIAVEISVALLQGQQKCNTVLKSVVHQKLFTKLKSILQKISCIAMKQNRSLH